MPATPLRAIARVLIAGIFVMAALPRLTDPAQMAGAIGYATPSLKAVGVPESLAQPLVYAATLLEVGGGLLLALGFESIGATLLAVFIVCMTPIMHNPTSGDQMQIVQFLKNASILGGLLYAVAAGAERKAARAEKSAVTAAANKAKSS